MSFDPSTAVPIDEEPTAFDPSTAVPVEGEFDPSTAVLLEDAAPAPEAPPERPTGALLLTPQPTPPDRFLASSDNTVSEPPPPLDLGEEQAATLARDAIADSRALRGVFTPDSEPFRIVDGNIAVDPARYTQAASALWKDGLIDSDTYFRMRRDAPEIESLWQDRRELEQTAGANPELKAALYGLGKGGFQLASALGAGATAAAGLAPTGPGAIVGGIAAGTGAAVLSGDMFDTFAQRIAETDDTVASFLAARELAPGYDAAGQFASILIPSPLALSRLSTATKLIATERGTAEAAKFAGRVTLSGAGIGAATDTLIQGAGAGLSLANDQPPTFSPEQLAISTTLGALTAGLGVRSRNRVYFRNELPELEQKVKLGAASREESADYFSMRRTVEILRQDERLLDAGAIAKSTVDFMGNRVLDTNTLINPRFQRDILTQAGFEPAPVTPSRPALTAATEPIGGPVPGDITPPTYTGQPFITRPAAAPTFQGGTNQLPGPPGIPALPSTVNPQVIAENIVTTNKPITLFHGTSKSSAKAILDKGWSESESQFFMADNPVKGIWLSGDRSQFQKGANLEAEEVIQFTIPAGAKIAEIEYNSVLSEYDSLGGDNQAANRVTQKYKNAGIDALVLKFQTGSDEIVVLNPSIATPSTATPVDNLPPTASTAEAAASVAPEPTGSPDLITGQGASVSTPTQPSPKLEAVAATPEPVRQSQPVDTSVMREQKKFLVSEIDRLLAEAPDITPQAAGRALRPDLVQELAEVREQLVNLPRFSGDRSALQDREKQIDKDLIAAAPTITIEVPGDGVFTIINTKASLTEFARLAKKFPSTASRPAVPAAPASNPTQLAAVTKGTPTDLLKAASNFIYKDTDRGSISQIWQNEDYTVATDGSMLLATQGAPPPKSKLSIKSGQSSGWYLNPKTLKPVTKVSDDKFLTYPDWPKVLPPAKDYSPIATADAGQLLLPLNQAKAMLSGVKDEAQRTVQLYRNPDFTIGISSNIPDEAQFIHNVGPAAVFFASYQVDRLRTVLSAMRTAGESNVRFHLVDEMTPLAVENGKAFAALMPMRVAGPSEASKPSPLKLSPKERNQIFWPYSSTPAKSRSGGKSLADAGRPGATTATTAATPPPPPQARPELNKMSDAQIFADYPNAVGVIRANNGAWSVPLILGGLPNKPAIEMPEIVEFYRQLAGQDPTLKNFSKALGKFYPATGGIKLRPDLFVDPQSATMTLAHEVGHFWSWADEGEIRLGNLGGHIQNIHNFLKSTFPIDKGGKPLTAKERKQLRAQAIRDVGPKPPDDPGEWNQEVARRYRELVQEEILDRNLAYVGTKSGEYDPNVREELINLSEWWKPFDYDAVPESYINYRHSAAELFADAISVLFMSPADLQQRAPTFWKAFFNHMDSRPAVKAKYLDIMHRVLRGPEAVLDHRIDANLAAYAKADEIFMAAFAEAESRRNAMTGLWEDLLDQYWDQYYPITSAIRKAEQSGKFVPASDDPYRFLTEEHPLSDSLVQLAMSDMNRLVQRLDAAGIGRYDLDLYLESTRIAYEKREVVEEIDGIMQTVGWEGSAVVANPRGETPATAQAKLARRQEQLGFERWSILEKAAEDFRGIFHSVLRRSWEKGVLTDEAWQKFDSNDFYATFTALKYISDTGSASIVGRKGTFGDTGRPSLEMMKKMVALFRQAQRNEFRAAMIPRVREGEPDVIRDAPMEYNGRAMVPAKPRDKGWELITWREKGQLRGVHMRERYARAFDLHSPAIEDAILRTLNTGFRETVYNLIIRYNPTFQLGSGPVMDWFRSIRNMPGGLKGRRRFALQNIQDVLQLARSRDGRRVLLESAGSAVGILGAGPAGAAIGAVGSLPGSIAGGLVGANAGGLVGFYVGRLAAQIVERALPFLPDQPTAAVDWARGDFGRSVVLRDMIENFAISGPWAYAGRGMTEDPDKAMSALLGKFAQAGKPPSKNPLVRGFRALINDIEFAGQVLQLVPKTSAWKVMSKDLGMPKNRAAYWVRNHIGLPNIAKRGRHIRNFESVGPFANVMLRSLESFYKLLGSGPSTRPERETIKRRDILAILGGFGLIAVMQRLAAEGAFGEEIQKVYAGASEYYLSNLPVIGLGNVDSPTGAKSALLVIPVEHELRFLFSLVSKAAKVIYRASTDQPLDVGASDIVTGFSAVTPSVNPYLSIGATWGDYGMGKTPVDHRNLPIVSRDEQIVGGTAGLKPMLGWTLDELGVSNFFRWDPRANTYTEAAIKPLPIFNRFLKITDAGVRERERSLAKEDERIKAEFRLGFPGFIGGLNSEYYWLQKLGDKRTRKQDSRYLELGLWRSNYNLLLSAMETEQALGNEMTVRLLRQQLINKSKPYAPR